MKTLKVMGIVGLVLSVFAFFCAGYLINIGNYYSASGWGMLVIFYSVAYSIVGIVQSGKSKDI